MSRTFSEHCQKLGMKLGIKHSGCNICTKQRSDDVSHNLTIDKNCADLKKMHCIAAGELIEDVPDSPRTSINMFASIMNQQEILNRCKNMLRAARLKYKRMNEDKAIEDEVVQVVENSTKVKEKKDRQCEPCMKLSARRKKHCMREVKDPII